MTVSEQELISLSQEAVRQQLQSPASAKFPGTILELDQYQIREANGVWTIRSHVDAQNLFGAMLRARWIVVIDATTPGQPRIVSATVIE